MCDVARAKPAMKIIYVPYLTHCIFYIILLRIVLCSFANHIRLYRPSFVLDRSASHAQDLYGCTFGLRHVNCISLPEVWNFLEPPTPSKHTLTYKTTLKRWNRPDLLPNQTISHLNLIHTFFEVSHLPVQ